MKALLIGLVLMTSLNVSAEIKTFGWREVTEFTDDSIIPEGVLTSYKGYCEGAEVFEVGSNLTSHSMDFPAEEDDKTYNCYITALAGTSESGASAIVSFTIIGNGIGVEGIPKPPIVKMLN